MFISILVNIVNLVFTCSLRILEHYWKCHSSAV